MDEIKNLENIFLGTNKELLESLNEKKIWIQRNFFVPGNLNFTKDENDLIHYNFIESLYNNVLLFESVNLNDKKYFSDEELKQINYASKNICILNLFDKIDVNANVPFWVEYNFNKMELSMFQDLFSNFYHKINFNLLKIDKKNLNNINLDLIKSLIVGEKGESIIILSKDKLLNLCYYCPILYKIYYKKNIDGELFKSLEEISRKNNIEMEEIDGD